MRSGRLFIVLLAGLLCWSLSPPTAAHGASCPQRSVLASNAQAVVAGDEYDGPIVACWRSTGQRTTVDVVDELDYGQAEHLRLAGHFASLTKFLYTGDSECAGGRAAVADLARRRSVVFELQGGAAATCDLRSVLLAPDGAFAYVGACDPDFCGAGEPERAGENLLGRKLRFATDLWKRDRAGFVLLDKGSIDRRSLRVQGHRLSWTKAGRQRTALLVAGRSYACGHGVRDVITDETPMSALLSPQSEASHARFGCDRTTGRRTPVGGQTAIGPVGYWVATTNSEVHDNGDYLDELALYDLRRAQRYRFPITSRMTAQLGVVLLDRAGSVAWAMSTPMTAPDRTVTLLACPISSCYDESRSATRIRTLDQGAISTDSIKLTGSVVTWTNDGEQRSANLEALG